MPRAILYIPATSISAAASIRSLQLTFPPTRNELEHLAQGLTLKSNTKAAWDWEASASLYDYRKDLGRTPQGVPLPAALNGGAGRITDMSGTGWNTLALKGVWRPADAAAHVLEFGYQREAYKLRPLVSDSNNWMDGNSTLPFSAFNGDSQLQSLYAQDAWRISPQWKTIVGGRLEQWRADNGSISARNSNPAACNGNLLCTQDFGARQEHYFSPKAALSYSDGGDWTYKASLGRAVRMPTVSELYQGSLSANTIINNDPNLKPEKSWTSELSAERALQNGRGLLRATLFHENTRDALYSQTNTAASATVSTIQNVDAMRTTGLELAYQAYDLGWRGLDVSSSLTYTHSIITRNDKFPTSVGMWQPRVPEWRANLLLNYHPDEKWSYALGARYSGKQYGTLDNSDPNGYSYTGFSSFFVADARIRYQFSRQWSMALGVDNLNNKKYWAFHPYTQRTVNAELKFDY
jgi:iron complex outermembrane receptor protein